MNNLINELRAAVAEIESANTELSTRNVNALQRRQAALDNWKGLVGKVREMIADGM